MDKQTNTITDDPAQQKGIYRRFKVFVDFEKELQQLESQDKALNKTKLSNIIKQACPLIPYNALILYAYFKYFQNFHIILAKLRPFNSVKTIGFGFFNILGVIIPLYFGNMILLKQNPFKPQFSGSQENSKNNSERYLYLLKKSSSLETSIQFFKDIGFKDDTLAFIERDLRNAHENDQEDKIYEAVQNFKIPKYKGEDNTFKKQ